MANPDEEHALEQSLREFDLLEPKAPPRPAYAPHDFEITDADWVRDRCLKAIETLAAAQDNQTEGGRAYNLWPRAEMAHRIAMGGGIDPDYVTARFTEAAYRCGMDTDVSNGGMRNVEIQLRRAQAKAENNGPLPPPTPGSDLCGTAFQFDPDELLSGQLGADTPMVGDPDQQLSDAVEPPRATLEAIEADFWTSRPGLQLVYTAALAQLTSPWAVLACCVARVLVAVPPEVRLPPVIGGPGSLNWFAAISAKSGGGKGAAMSVARDLVRDETIVERNIGSGEGMIECYSRRAPKQGESLHDAMADWVTGVLFVVDEIDNLGSMGQRSGQTTMGILRQGFSGERLGFAYRGRGGEAVMPHTYRMTLVASVQPERAGVLFDDAGGGTPQRFMWFPGRDKRITQNPKPWPGDEFGPARLALPGVGDMLKGAQPYVSVPAVATSAIREARVRSMQGDEEALDGHALFCREKFAYALALMDGRTAITEEDWRLSGIAAEVSEWCRYKAQQGYRGGKERVSRERGEQRALEDDERGLTLHTVQQRHLNRVGAWVVQTLEDGPMTRGMLNKMLSSRDRPRLQAALELAAGAGRIAEVDGRWQLCPAN